MPDEPGALLALCAGTSALHVLLCRASPVMCEENTIGIVNTGTGARVPVPDDFAVCTQGHPPTCLGCRSIVLHATVAGEVKFCETNRKSRESGPPARWAWTAPHKNK